MATASPLALAMPLEKAPEAWIAYNKGEKTWVTM